MTEVSNYRKLELTYNDSSKYYPVFEQQLLRDDIQEGLRERNIVVERTYSDELHKFVLNLYGYDEEIKLTLTKFDENSFEQIFNKIDKMPIRKMEMKKSGRMDTKNYKNKYNHYKNLYMNIQKDLNRKKYNL